MKSTARIFDGMADGKQQGGGVDFLNENRLLQVCRTIEWE